MVKKNTKKSTVPKKYKEPVTKAEKKEKTEKTTTTSYAKSLTAKFRIFRYDPSKDSKPYYKIYIIEVDPSDTILDALDKIKAQYDGSLTYRKNCRNLICGSCSMRINGRAALACKQHIIDELSNEPDKEILLEPMKNMQVIKDLVVDMKPFWDSIEVVEPFVDINARKIPEREFLVSKQEADKLIQSSDCIMCGACYSDCNSVEVEKRFLGPAAFTKVHRLAADSRDSKSEERIKKCNKAHGVWDCTHCFYCVEVCPRDVAPMDQILKLRKISMDKKIKSIGMRHHDAFVTNIEHSGLLNEITLPIKSAGVFNPFAQAKLLPVGIRMMLRRKMPKLRHKPIEKLKEFKQLIKEVKINLKNNIKEKK